MVSKKILEDYESNIDQNNMQEDTEIERELINNNLQLIEKEIEPHSKDYFEIINRDLQQGNIREGGMMYMITLESYHRSLTYTIELKQKLSNPKQEEYYIIDPEFDINSIDWESKDEKEIEKRKNIPKILMRYETKPTPIKIKRLYKNRKNEVVEIEENIKEIGFLKSHILNSPLERGSHFIVVSNSVYGFLRKNRRTIAREVNAKTTDAVEAGKPIIMKNNRNDYFNSGGTW